MQIKDKIVVVTGASEGIGAAIAKLLTSNGAKVVLASRKADVLKKMSEDLPSSFIVPTDMRKPTDITNLVNKTIERFGRIDIFINNVPRRIVRINKQFI